MGIIDRIDVQSAYKKEAKSLLKKIKKGLSSFNEQRAFCLFRYAHTLKGISGTCGNYGIEKLAGGLTEIFRAAKNGKLEISIKDKNLIKKNLDACERLLRKEAILKS